MIRKHGTINHTGNKRCCGIHRESCLVDEDATIAETVASMTQMDVSFMIVVDEGRYIGVVSSQLLANKLSALQES